MRSYPDCVKVDGPKETSVTKGNCLVNKVKLMIFEMDNKNSPFLDNMIGHFWLEHKDLPKNSSNWKTKSLTKSDHQTVNQVLQGH